MDHALTAEILSTLETAGFALYGMKLHIAPSSRSGLSKWVAVK